VPLRRLISDCSRDTVSVNALLAGAENEILQKAGTLSAGGFRAAKLKVGRQSLEKDISLTRQVRRRVGDSISLRLDANRAWDVKEALAFSNQVAECDIEYIEEPVHDYVSLLELVQNRNPAVGVALDESLSELTPDTLPDVPNTAAIILKPTALGLERSIQFARRAAVMGAKAVISSSFESGLALTALAELAACFNTRDVPAGLDTLAWLERDILEEPISVKNGVVELPTTPVQPDDLKWRMLREVTDE
jgi:O-succinylbenzoate synthase